MGFVAIAAIVGWASDRGRCDNQLRVGVAMLAGEVVLQLLRALWLIQFFGISDCLSYGVGTSLSLTLGCSILRCSDSCLMAA
ncbi:hypothetical protein [uncultured Jannaschia sp.]|uniref:hypothetical protein n=1 Tax=uncultured Jannaschia sp. TaxID=293347 RepID=UPI003419B96E